MMVLTLISLVLNYIGQKKMEKNLKLSYTFVFAGMYAFLIGILYFANNDLGFGLNWELSFLYIVVVGAIIAKYDIERTKEAIRFKMQSYTTYEV